MTLPEHGGVHGHPLADDRLGRPAAAVDRGLDVGTGSGPPSSRAAGTAGHGGPSTAGPVRRGGGCDAGGRPGARSRARGIASDPVGGPAGRSGHASDCTVWRVEVRPAPDRYGAPRESDPPVHRPHRPARAAAPAGGAGHQPALVVAPGEPGPVRRRSTRAVALDGLRPGPAARRGPGRAAGGARRRRRLRRRGERRRRGPARLPGRRPLVPDARCRTRPRASPTSRPEFGIAAALPQYSGGLGILAGDHLKAASDLGVPIVGVGLFYRVRLLPAVAVPRGVAAGALPGARPGRHAAGAAARGRRHAGQGRHRPAGRRAR